MVELTLICLALVVVLAHRERQHFLHTVRREQEWSLERSGLLTRIQHPEIIVGQATERPVPDEELLTAEPDEIDAVGTIVTEGGEDG